MAEEQTPEQKAKDEQDERELNQLLEQVTETNKKLDDVYDEKFKEIESRRKMLPTNEKEFEAQKTGILALREKYNELMSMISQARKAGRDPIIAAIIAKSIPPKIKLAEVTNDLRDYTEVEELIKRSLDELSYEAKEEVVNVKKEIEERLERAREEARNQQTPISPVTVPQR